MAKNKGGRNVPPAFELTGEQSARQGKALDATAPRLTPTQEASQRRAQEAMADRAPVDNPDVLPQLPKGS